MRYRPEPAPPDAPAPSGTGGLLCNLGTPEAPTTPAVRRYLAQFLSDPRIVEAPRALWLPVLHGWVLRTRPARSAAKYRTVWTEQGSPLLAWSKKQASLLRGYLHEADLRVAVRHAMCYGQPAIAQELDALKAQGCARILVLPLYPQYSATTTASVHDAVFAWGRTVRSLPELRLAGAFHAHAGYVAALAGRIRQHWQAHGRPDVLLLSFHGLPQRMADLGDPYPQQCHETARLLAQALGLREGQYVTTFQSRFGPAKWLQPYTAPTLARLGQAGTGRVDVACPGFVSDCLETLEEIAEDARGAFLHAGGREFHYIPALNDDPDWIRALVSLVQQHLQGWPAA